MSKQTIFLTIFTLAVALIAAPAFGQHGAGTHSATSSANVASHSADHAQQKSDFVSKIERNPTLSANLQALLPSGESLSQAAAGFKNEGQFIAALHVSHNLNIPFDQLKAKLTGDNSMSLGAAIKASRPDMSETQSKEAAKKAEKEAKESQKS